MRRRQAAETEPLLNTLETDSVTTRSSQAEQPSGPISSRRTTLILVLAISLLSVIAFSYFFANRMTNHYGDGIAHANIARKVVDHPDDSLWQRYMQIGSPWLPLQTVLMLPLVANDSLWRSGAAGSLVSMLCFVITALALFRLARHLYAKGDGEYRTVLPYVAVGIFALNPSVLFMQATPMSELVFMAALTVAVWQLQEWVNEQTGRRLAVAAAAMTMATMARYEAWAVAAISCLLVFGLTRGGVKAKFVNTAVYSLIVALLPIYWLWHNWVIYDDALWFLTGPHSARGIYLQNRANLGWSKIFVGNAVLDLLLMTVTVAACVGLLTILVGWLGFGRLLLQRRRALLPDAPILLLVVPFGFHCFSLYRGEIQIFPLTAFGLLNVRYGLPHLLGLALFAPALIPVFRRFGRAASVLIVSVLLGSQYAYLLGDGFSQLAVYQEGFRNGVNSRPARQWMRMAEFTAAHPPEGTVWMQTGSLGPVVTQGGLRFAGLIHEGTSRWHQIEDQIPADVSTLIVEKNDVLDERIKQNQALRQDFALQFEERFAAGDIKLYGRKRESVSGQ